MNRKGKLLLVEVVVPNDDAHCFSKLLDLNMMVMTGKRERTRAEFATLLSHCSSVAPHYSIQEE
jgi:hypothetical protein